MRVGGERSGLAPLAARLPGTVVLVIGDVMLDEYFWGDPRPLSPDATTPVVHLSRRHVAARGAANTAAGVVALGGRAYLGGVLGADANGGRLSETLRAAGIATDGLIRVEDRPTTTKNMIISGENPVMRLDVEDARPVCATTEATLIGWMRDAPRHGRRRCRVRLREGRGHREARPFHHRRRGPSRCAGHRRSQGA